VAVSDDLLEWEIIARVGEEYSLNESDSYWRDDGEAWIVARSATKHFGSCFCSAPPPYTDWKVTELAPMVHAPSSCRLKESSTSRVQPHPDNTASPLEAVDVYFAGLELADGGEWWTQTHSDPAKTPKME